MDTVVVDTKIKAAISGVEIGHPDTRLATYKLHEAIRYFL